MLFIRRLLVVSPLALLGGLVVFVGSSLAQSDAGRTPEPGRTSPSPALSSSDPDFAAGERREEARRRRLDSGEARQERRQSRERYRDTGPREAVALAQETFPEAARARLFDAARPAEDLRVERLLERGAAVVVTPEGERVVMQSSLPLEGTTPAGARAPLDLALGEVGEAFAPRSSLTPIRIAKQLQDGVRFLQAGFSVAYQAAQDGATPDQDGAMVESADRVFAPEAASDTDFFVVPSARGAKLNWQLRSPESPEELALEVDLPPGAVLRRARSQDPIPGDPPQTIEIARGEQTLGYVYPPLAYDADGQPVASKARIEGSRIVTEVAHRDGDFRYPILVDPEVIQPNDYYTWGWAGWRFDISAAQFKKGTSASDPGLNDFGAALNDPAYAPGMYESMPTNTYFDPGAYGQWSYRAPGETYIYRTQFGSVDHSPLRDNNGASFSRSTFGLMNSAYSAWEQPVNYVDQNGGVGANPFAGDFGYAGAKADFCFTPIRCERSKGSEQNYALFILQAKNDVNGQRFYTYDRKAQMTQAYANVFLGDRRVPTIASGVPPSSGWRDDGGSSGRSVTFGARDQGLGLKSVTLSGSPGTTQTQTLNCSGDVYRSVCPKDWSPTFSYTVGEGVNERSVFSQDIVDNRSPTQTWTERIDRSAPGISLSGRLADNDGKTISEAAYGLRVSATDGVKGGSASQQRSGVKSVEVLVDGKRVEYAEQACPEGSCPLEVLYTLRPDDFKHGRHTVKVVAIDQLGHRTERAPIEVTVDHNAGERGNFEFEEQQLFDRGDLRVNVANGNLVVHGEDVKIAGLGLNLAIDRFYNSRESQTASDQGFGWNLNTGASLRLSEVGDGGAVRLHGPSGYIVTFTKNAGGGFDTPRGVGAELEKTSEGAYTLTVDGSKEEYRFGSGGRLIRHEDKNDRSTTFRYDAEGRVIELTDTRGRVVGFGYNAQGLLEAISGPSGRTWRYGYDAAGDLRSYTDPAGGVTRYDYDAQHRLVSVTDPRGAATTIAYDEPYRRVASITRDGKTTRFAYDVATDKCDATDKATDATKVTDARGNATTFCADRDEQVLRVEDALGHKRGSGYDSQGNVTSTTSATGNATSFNFDGRNLKSATSATGASNTFEYNDTSNPHLPTKATNAQGNSLAYSYDGQGNLTSTAASGGDTQAETLVTLDYNKAADEDPEGTLKSSTDGNGHKTAYDYDDRGHLIEEDPPGDDQGTITYRYDALSRPIAVRDGKGQLRTIDYDALDRVVKITYADGTSVGYSYDQNGNRTERRDRTGTTSYGYDARNQKLEERLPGGAVNTYGYDGVGNLLSLSDQGGTVGYDYNEVNLLTRLTEPGGAQTTFRYTDDNQRELTIFPNGVQQKAVFDKDERVQDLRARKGSDGQLITDLHYDYKSPSGRSTNARQSVQDGLSGDTTKYTYDFLNRLKQAKTTDDSSNETVDDYRYTYDRNSNRRLSETHNGETINYDYNQSNELQSRDKLGDTGQVTYDYDQNGNLTSSSAGLQMEYNAANQTTQIRPPDFLADSGALADLTQPRLDLAYAGEDQTERVKKGSLSFQHNTLGLGREQDTTQATHYIRDNQGKLIALRRGGQSAYYLTDSLGTVLAVTGGDGSVGVRYAYDPFGQVKDVKGDLAQPYRFAGEYYDAETRFYKIGLRYYDPKTARFTQNDPIVGFTDPRRANRYIYAGQDPINNTDPTGASFEDVFIDVGCSVAGGVSGFGAGLVTGAVFAVPTGGVALAATGVVGFGVGQGVGRGCKAVANAVR